MSVKGRVQDIATQVANQIGQQLVEIRMRQFQQSLSAMAKVARVDGNQVTLNMPNGSQKTVTNLGGRTVGPGDPMLTDQHSSCF